MHLPMVACDPFNYGPPNIQAGYSMFRVRDNGPRDRMNQRWSVDVKNSVQIGRHLLDFGGSASRCRWTFDEVVYPRGVYGFDGVQTAPAGTAPTAAHRFADFLLGLAHALTLSPTPFDIDENSWNTNLYFQDNWRLSRNLTLNLGLRWDLFMRPIQEEGTIANYFMDNNGGLIASGKFFDRRSACGLAEGAGLQRLSRLRAAGRGLHGRRARHRRPRRIRDLLFTRDLELLHQHGAERSIQSVRQRRCERVGPYRVWQPRRGRAAVYRRRSARSVRRRSSSARLTGSLTGTSRSNRRFPPTSS